jgi:hypothetical protein
MAAMVVVVRMAAMVVVVRMAARMAVMRAILPKLITGEGRKDGKLEEGAANMHGSALASSCL